MGFFSRLFGRKKTKPIEENTKNEQLYYLEEGYPTAEELLAEEAKEAEKIEAELQRDSSCIDGDSAREAEIQPKKRTRRVKKSDADIPMTVDEESDEADKITAEEDSPRVEVRGFGGAFEIKRSRNNKYVFNLYAANRVIIATSQLYSSAQSAMIGIKSVIANAERANVEDKTLKEPSVMPFPKWEIYIDKGGQYRFRLLATNGSCICHSQGYTQKSACKKGIESIIRTVKNAKIDKSYLRE